MPVDRLRVTVAHELGHLVMHALPNPEMEEQAFRFAGEFLMPAADIKHDLIRVDLPTLAALKPVWRVSMGAILQHALQIGRVSTKQYTRLRADLSRRGYHRREPAELDLAPEHPTVVDELIRYHKQELGYSVDDLSSALHIFTPEFQRAFTGASRLGSVLQLVV